MDATVKTAKLGTLREVKIRACSWLGADPEKRKKDRALREKRSWFWSWLAQTIKEHPTPNLQPQEVCKALLLLLLVFLNFMGSCSFKHTVAFNAYNYNELNNG